MVETLKRPLRSYVVRSRRMSDARRENFAELYVQFGLDPSKRPDWRKVFPGKSTINVEIGFGTGDSVMHYAKSEPDTPLVGFEVYPVGVSSLLGNLANGDFSNVKVVNADARQLLHNWFEPGQLGCVRLYFPDPWPKRRHRKRRIVNEEFVTLLAKLLSHKGTFHFKSDVHDYIEHVHQLLVNHGSFKVEQLQPCLEQAGEPLTRFEQRARRMGGSVWQLYAKLS